MMNHSKSPLKLIILDRDGVINEESKEYIKTPDEWIPLPHSLEAIARLSKAGFTIAVATNQSGLSRGLYNENTLHEIHNKMCAAIEKKGGKIDKIFYCPHHPDDHCECRKPKPGLLLQIANHYGVSLINIPFIGDGLRDVLAARAVHAKPMLVKTGYGEAALEKYLQEIKNNNTLIFENLWHAAEFVIKNGENND